MNNLINLPVKTKKNLPYSWYLNTSKHLAKTFFKEGDEPVKLTDGQAEIFAQIYFQLNSRVIVICCTQYGKSWVVAMATLLAAIATKEPWYIVAPTDKKAAIIMRHALKKATESPQISLQLQNKKEAIDRLRDEKSKKKITFLWGGSIETLTLNAINGKRKNEAAMGEGAPNIIFDEAGLCDDETEAGVSRMVGGYVHRGRTFILKIGNPFYRNHFFRTWNGGKYHKIFIDYKKALAEGRFTKDFIEEMREKPLFDVFYQNKFPEADSIDAKGFRTLISQKEFDSAFIQDKHFPNINGCRIGGDIGAGGDMSSYAGRKGKFGKIIERNQTSDTMQQPSIISDLIEKYKTSDDLVFVDDANVGRGVTDRCAELEHLERVNGIGFGEKAPTEEDREKFKNMRAFLYWQFLLWLRSGGKLPESQRDNFKDFLEIRYKKTSDDKILIEPKEELKKRIGHSPDDCDAFVLTFAPSLPSPELHFI